MTNAIEEAAFQTWLDSVPDSYGHTSLQAELARRYRALAALSAPTPSGLTEEEQAEGRRLLAEAEAAFELGETPDRVRTAKDLQAWLFFNAKELLSLSPAPGIDWKRVEEVRARHEYAEQKGGDLYAPEYCEWTFSQTHADRAFLLSLLPKQEKTDGQ